MTALNAPIADPRPALADAIARDLGGRVVLHGIAYDVYDRLVNDLDAANDRTRLTYDNGQLELEMPGPLHEVLSYTVCRLLEAFFHHVNMPYMPLGQTTWRRGDLGKGLEADGCYYVQHSERMERLLDIDLTIHPPPDLAIEAEITAPLVPKLAVYAALGVPEVWHIRDDASVHVLVLVEGEYVERETSVAAPRLRPELLARYLTMRLEGTHFATLKQFGAELVKTFGPSR